VNKPFDNSTPSVKVRDEDNYRLELALAIHDAYGDAVWSVMMQVIGILLLTFLAANYATQKIAGAGYGFEMLVFFVGVVVTFIAGCHAIKSGKRKIDNKLNEMFYKADANGLVPFQ